MLLLLLYYYIEILNRKRNNNKNNSNNDKTVPVTPNSGRIIFFSTSEKKKSKKKSNTKIRVLEKVPLGIPRTRRIEFSSKRKSPKRFPSLFHRGSFVCGQKEGSRKKTKNLTDSSDSNKTNNNNNNKQKKNRTVLYADVVGGEQACTSNEAFSRFGACVLAVFFKKYLNKICLILRVYVQMWYWKEITLKKIFFLFQRLF